MNNRRFCEKVSEYLDVNFYWYSEEDFLKCANFSPRLDVPRLHNHEKSLQVSIDFDRGLGIERVLEVYFPEADKWYILTSYESGLFSLQENKKDGGIIYHIDNAKSLDQTLFKLVELLTADGWKTNNYQIF